MGGGIGKSIDVRPARGLCGSSRRRDGPPGEKKSLARWANSSVEQANSSRLGASGSRSLVRRPAISFSSPREAAKTPSA